MKKLKKRTGPKTIIADDAERKLLKQCRDSIGSCREVGLVLEVTESAVRKVENGESSPNLLNAFMYSLFFKQPLEELFPDLYRLAKDKIELKTIQQ